MRISLPAAYTPVAFYLVATLPILLPLFAPGYVLVLDMVFAPHIPIPQELTNTYPFYAFLHLLNVIIPASIIQKLLLTAIFGGAGIGAYSLVRSLQQSRQDKSTASAWLFASYIAGIFYMYNPFAYTRLMAGQYLVLLGYALLPFFARAIWRFTEKPSLKSSLGVAALTTAIAITSIHTLVAAFVLAVIVLCIRCSSRKGRTQLKRLGAYSLLALGGVVALNSFWLVPLANGTSSLSSTIAGFSQQDLAAFATVPGELGTVGNILALQGFWGDEKNLYLLPQDLYGWWLIPIVLLWGLIAVGAVWSWRHQQQLFAVFAISGVIGLVLATGTTGSLFAPLNQWLAEHVPLFTGYREPQKAAVLLVLAYAYFISCASFWLISMLRQNVQQRIAAVSCMLLPVACIPMLVWGGQGQLQTHEYPHNWYQANQMLNETRRPDEKALFLPWHLYQPFTFSSGTVANPAEAFFDIPIISSKDPELGGAASYAYKHGSAIEKLDELIKEVNASPANQLQTQAARQQLVKELTKQNVRYILVSKNYDYQSYDFLANMKNLSIVDNSSTLTIYKIKL